MTVKLLAGNEVLLEQEYYSVGGGFIRKNQTCRYPRIHQRVSRTGVDLSDVLHDLLLRPIS
jgi:hypothetical protein